MADASGERIEAAIQLSCQDIGVPCLRRKQTEASVSFFKGVDVFVCLLTGYGKSLFSALLSLIFDSVYERRRSIVHVSDMHIITNITHNGA